LYEIFVLNVSSPNGFIKQKLGLLAGKLRTLLSVSRS